MTKSRGINAPRKNWSPEERIYLEVFYPVMTAASVAAKLGVELHQVYCEATRLSLKKSAAFKASSASGRLDGLRGSATRFVKGQQAHGTQFVKGVSISVATQFKKGGVPANQQEVGALRINTLGDIEIKTAPGQNQWLSLRRYVWERAYGPIPPGMCIVPWNGDRHDTRIENLRMFTRAETIRINLLAKYPKELRNVMALKGRLTHQIARSQEAANV